MTTADAESLSSTLLDAVELIRPIIEEHLAEGEAHYELATPVYEALRDSGLLRLWTPAAFGGHEAIPLTATVCLRPFPASIRPWAPESVFRMRQIIRPSTAPHALARSPEPANGQWSIALAPRQGFEPRTYRLTADRSTVELPGKASL